MHPDHSSDADAKPPTSWRWLLGLGIVSTAIYLIIRNLSLAFAFGAPQQGRPIPLVLLFFGLAFMLYLWASWIAARVVQQRIAVAIIVVFAILFRGIMLWSEPIQEVDIYRYLWDGAVSSQGISPFKYAPQTVLDATESEQLPTDLARLVALKRDPVLASILQRVHWRRIHTVYPPVSQAVFTAVHRLTPEGSSLQRRLFLMRSVLVLFDLATIGAVLAMLRLANKPLGCVTGYAWCPLLLKEVANSGHLDSIVVLITMTGIYFLVRSARALTTQDAVRGAAWPGMVAGSLLLAAGVGAKIFPLALLPWLVAVCFRRRWWYVSGPCLLLFGTLIVMRPMLPPTLVEPWRSSTKDASQNASGIAIFAKYWEMNDFLFLICVENLRPQQPKMPKVWFAVLPDSWRTRLVDLGNSAFGWSPELAPFFWTRTLSTIAFGLLAVWLAMSARHTDSTETWLSAAFLTIAWFWLISPTQNPWYWTWALPMLPFARGRAWWAVSGLVLVYYLRFWLEYEFPLPPVAGTDYNGTQFFDFIVTWLEFGPWFVWLTLESALAWRRSRQINTAAVV